MRDQDMAQAGGQALGGELRQFVGVAIEMASARGIGPALRPGRAALATPVEAPYREAARREIADRLELLFDEVAEPANQDTLGARLCRREVAPAQHRSVGGRKRAPDKARRGQKTLGEDRRPA